MEKDNVNHPEHYTKGPECIDVMIAVFGLEEVLHYCICNAFKYYWRHSNKNGVEDLDKAFWYIEKARDVLNNLIIDAAASIRYTDTISKLEKSVCKEYANYKRADKEF